MTSLPIIRAAQYLRMSTDHQRYSLANQAEAISGYALGRGYELTRSYFDPGKSGLSIEGRAGLQALLRDVLDPSRDFDAVLVLDISRWGRFQDFDQAAHYEFLCRSVGVRVLYCGEPFEDDGSATASIMKLLKRLMAAEFSRELSEKTTYAHRRLAGLGHHQGGAPGYGLRRIAVDGDGPRLVLESGMRKPLAEDHVIVRPGPPEELAVIKRIFHRYVRDERGATTISRELNGDGIPSCTGGAWTPNLVNSVLRNEMMIGVYVFSRTASQLNGKPIPRPKGDWVRSQIFPPIVSPKLFHQAQARMVNPGRERLSKPKMLQDLRRLLRKTGHLSPKLINTSPETASASAYHCRFGSLRAAYRAIGYTRPRREKPPMTSEEAASLLDQLRDAHERHGYLTSSLINCDPSLYCVAIYRRRFGSLSHAFELAGLPFGQSELCRRAHLRSVANGTCRLVRNYVPMRVDSVAPEAELLATLRRLYTKYGYVSADIIRGDPDTPPYSHFRHRFGSLLRAYELAGLPHSFSEIKRQAKRGRASRLTAAASMPASI